MSGVCAEFPTGALKGIASMLDPCLYACQESGVTNLQTFADGVKRDYDAIRAALETAWSNDLVAYYTSFAV